MMRRARAGVDPREPVELGELRVGVAWTASAPTRSSARASRQPRALFPHAEPLDVPARARAPCPCSCARSPRSHRGLFAEHADAYGDNVAREDRERCFAVTDAECRGRARAARRTASRPPSCSTEFDLLLTPTLAFVAPPRRGGGRLVIRDRDDPRFTYPFNALGWPALALPCGPAERRPAGVRAAGRPARRRRARPRGGRRRSRLKYRPRSAETGGEPMFLARPAAIVVLALLLASGAGAATRSQSSSTLAAPQKLHGFLLRAHEPTRDTFTRTPSFAWQPVMGANRYEFQLASSRTFGSGALLARKTTRTPAVSLADRRFRGSPARRTPCTRESAHSRRTARRRRGASCSASTCAGRTCRRRSRRRPA